MPTTLYSSHLVLRDPCAQQAVCQHRCTLSVFSARSIVAATTTGDQCCGVSFVRVVGGILAAAAVPVLDPSQRFCAPRNGGERAGSASASAAAGPAWAKVKSTVFIIDWTEPPAGTNIKCSRPIGLSLWLTQPTAASHHWPPRQALPPQRRSTLRFP